MRTPTQLRLAGTFALRLSASHALSQYLAWLAFTRGSAGFAGVVLAVRAATGLLVPLVVGRMHDHGGLRPVLRCAAVVEALAAVALVWVGSTSGSGGALAIVLALLLGATGTLFDTAVFPILLTGRPGRLRSHVLVGLSYDAAKIAGSSVVLALLAVSDSPVPVMIVSLLALSGWRLATHSSEAGVPDSARPGATRAATRHLSSALRTPLIALGVVTLLPGQLVVFQSALADGSFARFAILGTLFACGAVAGNLALQRVPVAVSMLSAAYLTVALGLLLALVAPLPAMALFGAGTSAYYQLTRALVVSNAPEELRGRASGVMAMTGKTIGALGSILAASATQHGAALLLVSAAVCATLAALLTAQRARLSRHR